MTFACLPFEDVFTDESGGNVKTPQGEYLPAGAFPIVDQGKALIGGYVNDESRLCGGGRPAIVFGDHTRCIKFVDFPFCMGADGVKVLRPKIDADLKYLYYYLRTLNLPDGGYDRHYKYLKRTEVVLPSLPEQRRIAAILDQADTLCVKRQEALVELNSLTQAIFIEMFGDPTTNLKEWEVNPLGNFILSVTNGMTRRRSENDEGTDIVLRLRDIRSGWIDFSDVNRITLKPSESEKFGVSSNDLLFIRVNGNPDYVGRCAVFEGYSEPVFFNDHIMRVKVDPRRINVIFLAHLLNGAYGKKEIAKHRKTSAGQHTINQDGLGKIQVPIPPVALQAEFVHRLESIGRQKSICKTSQAELNSLFTSLQHRAFRGEL